MTRPVWFVPVTFYLPADTPEDAACLIAEYLEDAAQAVLRSQGIVAVDVEAEKVGPCHDLFLEADAHLADGECEICHNVCDSTTASGMCGNCFERANA